MSTSPQRGHVVRMVVISPESIGPSGITLETRVTGAHPAPQVPQRP